MQCLLDARRSSSGTDRLRHRQVALPCNTQWSSENVVSNMGFKELCEIVMRTVPQKFS